MVSSELINLQKTGEQIRHVCILAHVDHGKTTLADSILASNGIIPRKMVGKVRFLDSRKDEQERGITMKSSSVAICHNYGGQNYLINLIDSPGHADFYGEVCTAVRLCDGAIILVDVIEGVCPQTKVALQQAWIAHLHPILVLNKIDRLILEWKLTPSDAYSHLVQLLEQVNAVVGELFAMDVIKNTESTVDGPSKAEITSKVFDWSSGLDESDDSTVYFSPEQGNVIFASALDGWGFGLSHFAKMYSEKLGCKEEVLIKTLWNDFYFNTKSKQIMKGAQAKSKKPLFAQFILENIWAVYNAILVNPDKSSIEKIVNSLNLKISPRDARVFNSRNHLQSVLSQWLPLSNAVLDIVCKFVPSPLNLSEAKIKGLMCSNTRKFENLPDETRKLKHYFSACSSDENAPLIVCVSKMFPISKDQLEKGRITRNNCIPNQVMSLSAEEIAQRREKARLMQASRFNHVKDSETKTEELDGTNDDRIEVQSAGTSFIAFARVYSGTLKKGQKVYVLGPKHDPAQALKTVTSIEEDLIVKDLASDQHITVATIQGVYLLMGENVEMLSEVPSGNVAGIAGLESHVLKSATLSNTVACPPFVDLNLSSTPIMRVAVEPCHPRDMSALVQGMKLLNQADPCVQVLIQESGEHVLITAGEVHLQRCINDLKERFAKIEINVSAPIVPFRETIISPPKVDMVNELIEESKVNVNKDPEEHCITIKTPNKLSTISIRAVPLPENVTKLLEQNTRLIKEQDLAVRSLCSGDSDIDLPESTIAAIRELKTKLNNLFNDAGSDWCGAVDQIWSFGPRRCGSNILLNRIPGYQRPSVWLTSTCKEVNSPLYNYDSSFISGFQLSTFSGPLCDEPMMGICFIVEDWVIEKALEQELDVPKDSSESVSNEISQTAYPSTTSEAFSACSSETSGATPYGPFTGQIMSTVKEACKRAFQAAPQRLMVAMYSCNIQVASDMLGKMYAVLGRRDGRVLHADLQEGSQTFLVSAELPVVESFDFANEIRKQTSGMAMPQLLFSHWEIVDVDPFWEPNTEEEYAHFGDKADCENRARKYMNAVRRRKGLPVDEKIVEHAAKQRTLSRKK